MSTENCSSRTYLHQRFMPERVEYFPRLCVKHTKRRAMELQAHAQRVEEHLVPAIRSFFRSVMQYNQTDQRRRLVSNVLQDMLRILTFGLTTETYHSC